MSPTLSSSTRLTPLTQHNTKQKQASSGMNSFNSQVQQESEVPCSPEAETTRSEEKVILASARPKKRAGRRVFKETRHPVYCGVRRRNNNKWVCEMRVPNNNSRIWLGTYPTPEMAARAHDVAALALRGHSACLNFADSPSRLSVPATTDPHQIRLAALHAAHSFASQECHQHHTANELPPKQGNMHVDQVQQCHDLLLRIADEPLMSPPPSPSARYGSHLNDDLHIFDAEVSLWNFSI